MHAASTGQLVDQSPLSVPAMTVADSCTARTGRRVRVRRIFRVPGRGSGVPQLLDRPRVRAVAVCLVQVLAQPLLALRSIRVCTLVAASKPWPFISGHCHNTEVMCRDNKERAHSGRAGCRQTAAKALSRAATTRAKITLLLRVRSDHGFHAARTECWKTQLSAHACALAATPPSQYSGGVLTCCAR